jgi:uncharacterized membrane protein YhaH (DUF805 family)
MRRWFCNFSFKGRARRSHVWANYATWLAILVVLVLIASAADQAKNAALSIVTSLLLLAAVICGMIDQLAIDFRRAHDTNKSGWVVLLLLLPLVNLLALYWFLIEDSNAGPNKYGPPLKQFYTPDAPSLVAP